MAYESNFDKKERRDAERRQNRARRQYARRRPLAVILVSLVALLVAVVLLYRGLSEPQQTPTISTPPPTTTVTTQPPEPTQPQNPTDQIKLVFGGDLVVNDLVVQSGLQGEKYDYTAIFQDILPTLANADVSGINFEGNTAGTPYGSATGSAPPELMNALAKAGVDVIQLANSCTVSNGILGLSATLQDVRKAGMTPVGAYSQKEQAQQEQGFTL